MAGFFESLSPVWKDTLRSTGEAMTNPNQNMGLQDILGYAAGSYLGNRMSGNHGAKTFQGDVNQQMQNYINSPQSATSQGLAKVLSMASNQQPITANIGMGLDAMKQPDYFSGYNPTNPLYRR